MKYATQGGVVSYAEHKTCVMREGDSFDDDHELVAERPELFTDEAPAARHPGRAAQARITGVETASTTPGGRRVGRR